MTESDPGSDFIPSDETWDASDHYPIRVKRWEPSRPNRRFVVILHGVQSHGGWYANL